MQSAASVALSRFGLLAPLGTPSGAGCRSPSILERTVPGGVTIGNIVRGKVHAHAHGAAPSGVTCTSTHRFIVVFKIIILVLILILIRSYSYSLFASYSRFRLLGPCLREGICVKLRRAGFARATRRWQGRFRRPLRASSSRVACASSVRCSVTRRSMCCWSALHKAMPRSPLTTERW